MIHWVGNTIQRGPISIDTETYTTSFCHGIGVAMIPFRGNNRSDSLHRGGIAMLKVLTAAICASFLIVTAGQAAAQENKTPDNKDKSVVEKTADKAKEGTQEVGDKAGDVKDKTVKGTKTAAKKTKDVAGEAADKAGDVKDKTVEGTKAAGEKTKDVVQEAGDKAEDAKDKTVKGAKVVGKKTKEVANETGDKAEDVKDKSAKGVKVAADKAGDVKDKGEKGAKKTGNWLTRTFKKIF